MNTLSVLCVAVGAIALGGPLRAEGIDALPTAAVHINPTPPLVLPADPDTLEKIDPTGYFFFTTKLPKAFGRIDHINLATVDENGQPAPLNGMVRMAGRSAPDYRTVNAQLEGSHITFTTAAVNGVSYAFDGTFQRTGDFSADPPPSDAVVLRGTFTKLKDGKAVIARAVGFRYEMGD